MIKKLLYIVDRGKQIIPDKNRIVIDYLGSESNIVRKGVFLENGTLKSEDVHLQFIGNQKIKSVIMKTDKRRRDARRKSPCAFYSVVSLLGENHGN